MLTLHVTATFSRPASAAKHGRLLADVLAHTTGVHAVRAVAAGGPQLRLDIDVDAGHYWPVYGLISDWWHAVPGKSGFSHLHIGQTGERPRRLPYRA